MRYDELYSDFIALFPEDSEYFKKLENETGAGVEDGMHVVFGMVVVPFVTKAVKEDFEKATKAFDFFEKMETSEDPRIVEVVEFTILEKILTEDRDMAPKFAKFFGEETLKAALAVGKWFHS